MTYLCLYLVVCGSSISFKSQLPENLYPRIPLGISPWLVSVWCLCLSYPLGKWLTTLHIRHFTSYESFKIGSTCELCSLFHSCFPSTYNPVYQYLICSQIIYRILDNYCVVIKMGDWFRCWFHLHIFTHFIPSNIWSIMWSYLMWMNPYWLLSIMVPKK